MAVMPVVQIGDAVLERVAAPVTDFDAGLRGLIADMFDTMYDAPGRGLAAPQVGIARRLFVVDVDWKDATPNPVAFINPVVTGFADEVATMTEGCLSIPGRSFDVARPVWVELTWQDVDGAAHKGRFDGIMGVCVQHEFDHLNGVLITQSGAEIWPDPM